MGNLRLMDAKFRYGLSGAHLDYLAREPLYRMGLDFKHGTGHGVGYLLNVHEGPNAIRSRVAEEGVFKQGMITSDEPGLYIEGAYGIRLENLILCVHAEKTEYGQFMQFEPLTFVPFDPEAVDLEMLTGRDKELFEGYQKQVYETLAPYLTEEEKQWLLRKQGICDAKGGKCMKTGNILVIDDDAEIREIVQVLLSSEGYTVETVADGMQALTMLTEKTFLPDVIILDIMMPDMDGYSVCKQIREISQVPVLFLTAKNRETDLVEGFLAGGDDYMQKPFSYTELIARVGGLMRRYRQYGGQSDPQKEKQVFISDLVIDKDQVSVTKNGKNVELTNTEYGILLLLSENKGKVFSLFMKQSEGYFSTFCKQHSHGAYQKSAGKTQAGRRTGRADQE